MTYEKAVALRTHQLCGHYVAPDALQQAIEIIQTTQTPTPWRRPKNRPSAESEPGSAAGDGCDMDAIYRGRA